MTHVARIRPLSRAAAWEDRFWRGLGAAVARINEQTRGRPAGTRLRAGTTGGALTFPAQGTDGNDVPGPAARGITLIVRDIAGMAERTFRWTWRRP